MFCKLWITTRVCACFLTYCCDVGKFKRVNLEGLNPRPVKFMPYNWPLNMTVTPMSSVLWPSDILVCFIFFILEWKYAKIVTKNDNHFGSFVRVFPFARYWGTVTPIMGDSRSSSYWDFDFCWQLCLWWFFYVFTDLVLDFRFLPERMCNTEVFISAFVIYVLSAA